MFTMLGVENNKDCLVYKGIIARCKGFCAERLENKETKVDNEYKSALKSMYYIFFKLRGSNFEASISRYMDDSKMDQLNKEMNGESREAKRNKEWQKRVTKRHKGESNESADNHAETYTTNKVSIIDAIGDIPGSGMCESIMNLVLDNNEALAEFMAETITTSVYAIVGSDELYVSPFELHSALVYYWAFKNGIIKENQLVHKSGKDRTIGITGENVEEFVSSRVKNEYSIEVAKTYLTHIQCQTQYLAIVYYEMMEEFIESTLKQAEYSKEIENRLIWAKGELCGHAKEFTVYDELFKILNIKEDKTHTALVAVVTPYVGNLVKCRHNNEIALYVYKLVETEQLEIEDTSKVALKHIINGLVARYLATMVLLHEDIVEKYCNKLKHRFDKLKSEKIVIDKKAERIDEKLSAIRQKYRDESKQLKEAKATLDMQSIQLEKNEAKLKNIVDPKQLEDIQAKLNRKSSLLEESELKNDDISRQLVKQQRENDELQEKLKAAESEKKDIEDKLDRERELNNSMTMHRAFNEIDIKCFVNAIKPFKVLLMGGDMMHPKLRGYGLKNVKYVKAGAKEITFEDMANMDLIVIVTAFIDHSSTEGVLKASKNHDIPLLKFNNTNADMLVYSVFSQLFEVEA